MKEILLVEREEELRLITGIFDNVLDGNLGLCFVAGNQGDGKTTFIESFLEHVKSGTKKGELHFAIGTCDIETQEDGAFEVFKDIFSQLTGVQANEIENALAGRYKSVQQSGIQVATESLVNIAPDLIGFLVPGVGLLAKAVSVFANETIKARIDYAKNQSVKPESIINNIENYFRDLASKIPVIIVVDDIQWIDSLSLKTLKHLIQELEDLPIMFIGAYRPNEIDRGATNLINDLTKLYDKPISEFLINLDVRDLSIEKQKYFVKRFLLKNNCEVNEEFVDEFVKRTQGKPLWAVELLRFLRNNNYLTVQNGKWVLEKNVGWGMLPDSSTRLSSLINRRLSELPSDLMEILYIASIEGYEFTAQVIASILDIPEKQILRILETDLDKEFGFVRPINEEIVGTMVVSHFRFSNIYYQEYIYEQILGEGEKRILHGQVAEVLEKLYVEDIDHMTIRIVNHYKLAQNKTIACDYLLKLGTQQHSNRQLLLAEETFSEALSYAQAVDYKIGIIRAKRHLAEKIWFEDRNNWVPKAKPLLEECIMLIEEYSQGEKEFELEKANSLIPLGRIYAKEASFAIAIYHYMESINIARKYGDLLIEGRNLTNIGVAAQQEGNLSDARFFFEKRLEIAKQVNYLDGIGTSYINLGDNSFYLGEYDKSIFYYQEAAKTFNKSKNDNRKCGAILGLARLSSANERIIDSSKYILEVFEIAKKKKYISRIKDGLLHSIRIALLLDKKELAENIWFSLNIKNKNAAQKEVAKLLQEHDISTDVDKGDVISYEEILVQVEEFLANFINSMDNNDKN